MGSGLGQRVPALPQHRRCGKRFAWLKGLQRFGRRCWDIQAKEPALRTAGVAQIEIQIITAVTAIVSSLLGAYAANTLAYKRSTREKIWETRRAAYGFILSHLSA